jgi:hypothetical protein
VYSSVGAGGVTAERVQWIRPLDDADLSTSTRLDHEYRRPRRQWFVGPGEEGLGAASDAHQDFAGARGSACSDEHLPGTADNGIVLRHHVRSPLS